MSDKRLTIALPEDVWARLRDEAAADGIAIGTLARRLIVARDKKIQARGVSAPSDTQAVTFGEPEVPDTDTWILANLDAWKEHGPKKPDGMNPYGEEWNRIRDEWVAANHHRF